jgi:hypothetical protein
MRVALGTHIIFSGPVSGKTLESYDPNGVRSLVNLVKYPWTEWKWGGGGYTVDSGLGASFATFVPLGFLLLTIQALRRRNRPLGVREVLLLWVALGALVWFFGMACVIRFALPLVCLSCVLSSILLDKLIHDERARASILLTVSFATTLTIAAFDPFLPFLARVRTGRWGHQQFYALPRIIEQLPEGSRILNRTDDETLNFPLAGEHLQNRVVGTAEAPSELTAEFLRGRNIDYVVERGPRYEGDEDLSNLGTLLADGADGKTTRGSAPSAGWRVWKIAKNR